MRTAVRSPFFSSSGPEADLDRRTHFVRQNLRERGFAEPRRTVEQHVVERFAASARRLHGDLQIFFHAVLADVVGEIRRAHAGVEARVFVERFAGNDSCCGVSHFRARL